MKKTSQDKGSRTLSVSKPIGYQFQNRQAIGFKTDTNTKTSSTKTTYTDIKSVSQSENEDVKLIENKKQPEKEKQTDGQTFLNDYSNEDFLSDLENSFVECNLEDDLQALLEGACRVLVFTGLKNVSCEKARLILADLEYADIRHAHNKMIEEMIQKEKNGQEPIKNTTTYFATCLIYARAERLALVAKNKLTEAPTPYSTLNDFVE